LSRAIEASWANRLNAPISRLPKDRSLEPEALIEEVERLIAFGEQIPVSLFADYIEKLLHTGHGARAREEVRSRLTDLDPRAGVSVAWVCYRKQAYDVACDLFMSFLESNLGNVKYLTSLEAAAAKCNRLTEVIEAYKRLAESSPKLHGRLKTLFKRIGS